MTRHSVELDNFIDVLHKRFAGADAGDTSALRGTLEATDVIDLARETADFDDAVDWLVASLRETAAFSPSAAFALAGRYAAQRGLGALGTADTAELTSGVADPAAERPLTATLPTVFAPEGAVLVDRLSGQASYAAWAALQPVDLGEVRRSGLRQAALRTVFVDGPAEVLPGDAAERIAGEWELFTTAVAVGLSERALVVAETYAGERRQFGSAIAAFSGLRAILAEMQLLVSAARALLEEVTTGEGRPSAALAVAGRTAVDVCVDAVQVLGGYGYIDEFPLTGLLRDALSIRARGGGRRALLADVATGRLGRSEVGA